MDDGAPTGATPRVPRGWVRHPQERMLITPLEAVQLISIVRFTSKLGGCMAELGVYRGGSARTYSRFGSLAPTVPVQHVCRHGADRQKRPEIEPAQGSDQNVLRVPDQGRGGAGVSRRRQRDDQRARVEPAALLDSSLGPLASAETRQTIARAESRQQAITLALMAPEFQRR